MRLMNLRQYVPAFLIWTLLPIQLGGQSVSVDENSFRLYRNGEAVGTEQFSIRQIGPAGQNRIILRGAIELDLPDGSVQLAPAMDAQGESLDVADYQIRVSGSENTDIFLTVAENRFMARIVSEAGNNSGSSEPAPDPWSWTRGSSTTTTC